MANVRTWPCTTMSDRSPVVIASHWTITIPDDANTTRSGVNVAGPWGIKSVQFLKDAGGLLVEFNDTWEKLIYASAHMASRNFTGGDADGKRGVGTMYKTATVGDPDNTNAVEFFLYEQKAGVKLSNPLAHDAGNTVYDVHLYFLLSNTSAPVVGTANNFYDLV